MRALRTRIGAYKRIHYIIGINRQFIRKSWSKSKENLLVMSDFELTAKDDTNDRMERTFWAAIKRVRLQRFIRARRLSPNRPLGNGALHPLGSREQQRPLNCLRTRMQGIFTTFERTYLLSARTLIFFVLLFFFPLLFSSSVASYFS